MTVKVLLVDSSREARKYLRSFLALEQAIDLVGEAAGGRTALVMLQTHHVDVVVMELKLSAENGIAVARDILAAQPRIRVLIVSLQSDPLYVKESFRAGATGYLLKDFAFEEMAEAIQTVAAGGSYVSPAIEIKIP